MKTFLPARLSGIVALAVAWMIMAGSAVAGPITGDTVTPSIVVPGAWSISPITPQTIPATFIIELPGVNLLDIGIDGNGQITVGPDASTCGSGCGYAVNQTFEFTLGGSAPPITGLQITQNDPNLGVTFSLVNASSFEISVSTGTGTTGIDETIGQLSFGQTAIPEPATLSLFGLALAALALVRRKRGSGDARILS